MKKKRYYYYYEGRKYYSLTPKIRVIEIVFRKTIRRGFSPAGSNYYFIEDNCTMTPNAKISQSILWRAWQFWAHENGYHHGSKKTFTRRLKDRGINNDGYHNGARAYAGVDLKGAIK